MSSDACTARLSGQNAASPVITLYTDAGKTINGEIFVFGQTDNRMNSETHEPSLLHFISVSLGAFLLIKLDIHNYINKSKYTTAVTYFCHICHKKCLFVMAHYHQKCHYLIL